MAAEVLNQPAGGPKICPACKSENDMDYSVLIHGFVCSEPKCGLAIDDFEPQMRRKNRRQESSPLLRRRIILHVRRQEQPQPAAEQPMQQRLVATLLSLRARMPEVFAHGSYEPLDIQGPNATHFLAFARRHESRCIIVVVPRLPSTILADEPTLSLSPQVLSKSILHLPFQAPHLIDAFDARDISVEESDLLLTDAFGRQPVAVLRTE